MKKVTCIILLLSMNAFGAKSDEQQLEHIKLVLWPKAYKNQDTKLLNEILHPSFQLIDNQGKKNNKSEELVAVEKHTWNAKNFKYTIERLDVYDGKTAVVSGFGETDTYQYSSSNVLIKSKEGKWQAILSHVSGYELK